MKWKNVLWLLLLAVGTPVMAQMQTAQIDGINYNLDMDRLTAEVGQNLRVSGELSIPEQIQVNGDSFTVTEISEKAFYGAKGLTAISFPESLERVYRSSLEGTGLYRDKENWSEGMLVIDHVLIAVEKGCAAKFVLPEDIRLMAAGAFQGNRYITKVELNQRITRIDHDMFRDCKNLVKLSIPENVTWIGQDILNGTAIWNNDKKWRKGSLMVDGCLLAVSPMAPSKYVIKSKVPVRVIACTAFAQLPQLKSVVIPEGITEIPGACFYECPALEQVTLPQSLKRIGNYAFYKCELLHTAQLPKGLESIGAGAFYQCVNLKEVRLGEAVKVIPTGCFYLCKAFKTLDLPEGLERIGDGAFSGCNEIRELRLPSTLEYIGEMAFGGWNLLRKVEIPSGVNTISKRTFYQCEMLERVDLPNGLYAIGDEAFMGCTALRTIVLPASTFRIGAHAFDGCISLGKINLVEHIHLLEEYAFSGCTALRKVVIPLHVKTIGKGCFKNCIGLEELDIQREEDYELRMIEDEAFDGCRNLKNPHLPLKVQMGKNVFRGCKF